LPTNANVVVKTSHTPPELEAQVGESLKKLRLSRNIDQKTLAERAGISARSLRSLENGSGSSLKSLVSVLRALDRDDWLTTMVRNAAPRQRARKRTAKPPK
jgi:transcriptional regulator with XRE-family HTH domain